MHSLLLHGWLFVLAGIVCPAISFANDTPLVMEARGRICRSNSIVRGKCLARGGFSVGAVGQRLFPAARRPGADGRVSSNI
jgi:hypothetical protein